jgi:hypothetical protein
VTALFCSSLQGSRLTNLKPLKKWIALEFQKSVV